MELEHPDSSEYDEADTSLYFYCIFRNFPLNVTYGVARARGHS